MVSVPATVIALRGQLPVADVASAWPASRQCRPRLIAAAIVFASVARCRSTTWLPNAEAIVALKTCAAAL